MLRRSRWKQVAAVELEKAVAALEHTRAGIHQHIAVGKQRRRAVSDVEPVRERRPDGPAASGQIVDGGVGCAACREHCAIRSKDSGANLLAWGLWQLDN